MTTKGDATKGYGAELVEEGNTDLPEQPSADLVANDQKFYAKRARSNKFWCAAMTILLFVIIIIVIIVEVIVPLMLSDDDDDE